MAVGNLSPRVSTAFNNLMTFQIPFPFFNAADITVQHQHRTTKVYTTLVQGVDCMVSGGNGGVGQVTLLVDPSPYHALDLLWIERRTQATQLLDYRANDDFPAESHEGALDRLTMIVQEILFRELGATGVRSIISSMIKGSLGITVKPGTLSGNPILTLFNNWDEYFIRDAIAARLVGDGCEIIPDPDLDRIIIRVPGLDELADCLMLSGDQQGGGEDPGGVGVVTGAQVKEIIESFLSPGAGIAFDTTGDLLQIYSTEALTPYTDANAIAAVFSVLLAGANINLAVNVDGELVISATGLLDAAYAGIQVIGQAGAFAFDNSMIGKAINYTGGAAAAALDLGAIAANFACRVRNDGSGILTVNAVGGSLFINGGGAVASAAIAQGGIVDIQLWPGNEATIVGAKVS